MKAIRFALLFALLIELAVAGIDVALRPLQERGQGNRLVSMLLGAGDMAKMPGVHIARLDGIYDHHITRQNVLLVHGADFIGYLAIGFLLAQHRRRAKQRQETGQKVSLARRHFLRVTTAGSAGALAWTAGYEPFRLEVTHPVARIKGLPPSLQGLRLLQLTDIHHGPWFSLQQVREVVEKANALGADMILLTGDYVHMSPAYIAPVARELGKLRAPLGVVAVLGNHDWREDGPLTQREFTAAGIRLLDNTRMILTPERRMVSEASEGLCIAGVGDLTEHIQDYRAAIGNLPPQMPRILLAHNPDTAEMLRLHRSVDRVDLMISGHTHGGQIWVPGLGTPVLPSMYGQKYASGWCAGPVCPVYVSRGIGMTILPLRFRVPPEIPIIELKAA